MELLASFSKETAKVYFIGINSVNILKIFYLVFLAFLTNLSFVLFFTVSIEVVRLKKGEKQSQVCLAQTRIIFTNIYYTSNILSNSKDFSMYECLTSSNLIYNLLRLKLDAAFFILVFQTWPSFLQQQDVHQQPFYFLRNNFQLFYMSIRSVKFALKSMILVLFERHEIG